MIKSAGGEFRPPKDRDAVVAEISGFAKIGASRPSRQTSLLPAAGTSFSGRAGTPEADHPEAFQAQPSAS